MSRSRNIKPGFFTNEDLATLPFWQRLLYIGLWTECDREGRCEDRPVKLKMRLFPADSVDVDKGLQALHDNGFILRYSSPTNRFIQVIAWKKHQNPHFREAMSIIPSPESLGLLCHASQSKPEADASIDKDEALDKPEESPGPASGEHEAGQVLNGGAAVLIPDSGFLIPDSLQEREREAHAPDHETAPTDAGRTCLLMRQAGCVRVNASHPDLLAALAEGVKPEAIRDTYLEFPDMDNPFAYAITTARKRHAKGAKQISTGPPRVNRSPQISKTGMAVQALEAMKSENRLGNGRDSDGAPEVGLPRLGSTTGG